MNQQINSSHQLNPMSDLQNFYIADFIGCIKLFQNTSKEITSDKMESHRSLKLASVFFL